MKTVDEIAPEETTNLPVTSTTSSATPEIRQFTPFANRPIIQSFVANLPNLQNNNRPNRPNLPNRRRQTPQPVIFGSTSTASPPIQKDSSAPSSPPSISINLTVYVNGDRANYSVFSEPPPVEEIKATTEEYDIIEEYDELTESQVTSMGGMGQFKPLHMKERNNQTEKEEMMDLF